MAICNATAYGLAQKEITKIRKKKKVEQAILDKVTQIEALLQQRVDALFTMIEKLAIEDQSLCMFYAARFVKSLKGYGKERETALKTLIKGIDKKSIKISGSARVYMQQNCRTLFVGTGLPKISDETQKVFTGFIERLNPKDQVYGMMKEYLLYSK